MRSNGANAVLGPETQTARRTLRCADHFVLRGCWSSLNWFGEELEAWYRMVCRASRSKYFRNLAVIAVLRGILLRAGSGRPITTRPASNRRSRPDLFRRF